MKILLISNMYPSGKSSQYGIFVKNFERTLNTFGVETKKVVIAGKSLGLLSKIKKYIIFYYNILLKVKHGDYDIVYVHFISHSLLPFHLLAWRPNKPLVVNAHGGDVFPIRRSGRLIKWLTKPIVKEAALVVVPSEYFSRLIKDQYGVEAAKVFVSPSGGICLKKFRPINRSISKDKVFRIGYVSRIDEGKGWDVLLECAKILKDQDRFKFEILIVGGGRETQQLLKKVSDYGLEPQVRWYGEVGHDDLAVMFSEMNVFVFPTLLNESLGLVGLEAMACGVPVIGSDIGGLKTYIKNGYSGETFPPGDVMSLVDKVIYFHSLPMKNYKQYSKNCIKTASKYDSDFIGKNLVNRLKELTDLS